MEPRLDYHRAAPELLDAMRALEQTVTGAGLEKPLIELVKTRASQINGCAFCIDMHTRDAMRSGETASRLLLLDAWREAPLYTPREQAALAWTEALTLVAQTRAPDADWDLVQAQFSAHEIVTLTLLIGMINAWNRLAIGLRAMPGR